MVFSWWKSGPGQIFPRGYPSLLNVLHLDPERCPRIDQGIMLYIHLVLGKREKGNGFGLIEETSNSKISRRVGAKKYFQFLKISRYKEHLEAFARTRTMGTSHKGKIPCPKIH